MGAGPSNKITRKLSYSSSSSELSSIRRQDRDVSYSIHTTYDFIFVFTIFSFHTRFFQVNGGDWYENDNGGSDWDENDDGSEPYIPPPRLLNAIRLFLPYKGYVEIGLSPESDGYGHANAIITMIVVYGNDWISLHENDIAAFFIEIRGYYSAVNGSFYSEPSEDFRGNFEIQRNGALLHILFREEEGDECTITGFHEDDAIALLEMEKIIAGRLDHVASTINSLIEVIHGLVTRCDGFAELIKRGAANWYCDNIEVEMVTNHSSFFYDFADEVKRSMAE